MQYLFYILLLVSIMFKTLYGKEIKKGISDEKTRIKNVF